MKNKQNSDRKLIDRLRSSESFGRLLGIVGTTFEMNVDFFETDFLPTLLGMGAWDDRKWSSRIALERQLAELETATIFQDTNPYRGRPRSMRIESVPVYLPGNSILHSKFFLAVYENAVRIIVGSANLTETGYRKNLETIAVLTASESDALHAKLIRSALPELNTYLGKWMTRGASNLIEDAIQKLDSFPIEDSEVKDWIVWSGKGEPLWKKFLERWPSGRTVSDITVVSPFWSEEKSNSGPTYNLLSELQTRGQLGDNASLALLTNGLKAGGEWLPRIPESICSIDFQSFGVTAVAHSIDRRVPPEEIEVDTEVEYLRELHAKIVIIEDGEMSLAYFGSANFTRHGWGFMKGSRKPNIETGVIVLAESSITKPLVPKSIGTPIPLSEAATGKLAGADSEPDANPWPYFLESLLLAPSQSNSHNLLLEFNFDPSLVEGDWLVGLETESGFEPFKLSAKSPSRAIVELNADTLRQILKLQEVCVKWWGYDLGRMFPVNVSMEARPSLPISPESGGPKEHHLIAYYQGRIRWEDLFPDPTPDSDSTTPNPLDEVDEQCVDTSKIQSYVVREFVEALQGINDDLESAAQSTAGCMRLALLGSVSPLALAKHIFDAAVAGERTPMATGFQLVEILSCLQAAQRHTTSEQFSDDWLLLSQRSANETKSLLQKLIKKFPADLTDEFHQYAKRIEVHHHQQNMVAS